MDSSTWQDYDVFISSPYPMIGIGIKSLLEDTTKFTVTGVATKHKDALKQINGNPLIITDINKRFYGDTDAIDDLVKKSPESKILVISTLEAEQYAGPCVDAGAKGYIMLDRFNDKNITTALNRILANDYYFNPNVTGLVLDYLKNNDKRKLSKQQEVIFSLLGRGYTTGEIAKLLNRSIKTISTHVSNIAIKLHVDSILEVKRYALYCGNNGSDTMIFDIMQKTMQEIRGVHFVITPGYGNEEKGIVTICYKNCTVGQINKPPMKPAFELNEEDLKKKGMSKQDKDNLTERLKQL